MNTDAADKEGTAEQLPAVSGDSSLEVIRERTRGDEVKRAKLIREIARRFNCQDFGEKAIEEGLEVPTFEHRVLTEVLHAKPIDFSKYNADSGSPTVRSAPIRF